MRKSGLAFRYAVAILAGAFALYLRYLLTPLLGNQNNYHTVWLAVAFSAWYCGVGPSIVTTILSTLGVWYWFLPPPHSFAIPDRTDVYGMLGFLVFSAAMIVLGDSNRNGLAARAKLAAIVESSCDAIVGLSLDGVISSWNRGAGQIFGYSAEEAIGKPISLIATLDRVDEVPKLLERIKNAEWIDHYETIQKTKNGTLVNVSLTVSPVWDAQGRIVGASKIVRDITDQKRDEEALRDSEQRLRDAHDTLERKVEERTRELQLEISERKAAERRLQESEQSLRQLSVTLMATQDQERRRIARELHDGVGQLLAAMSMNTSKLQKERSKLSPDGARCAEENSKLLEQVSANIRTVSYLFHPPLLDEMGLHSALRWYIEGFAERSKIAAKLELPADEDGERLPPDYELCLFRITQECLTNIHRHSGSSIALIRLLRSATEIKLVVSDGGKGVNKEIQSRISSGETAGVGLRGMQERVRTLGGSIEIQSNGKGTTVTATLPLAESGRSGSSSSDDGHESHSPVPERSADLATTIVPEQVSARKAEKA
jgi:PAS domain S-box-containing protein